MKTIIIVINLVILAGCDVYEEHINVALEICKTFGGIKLIESNPARSIRCKDGTRIFNYVIK